MGKYVVFDICFNSLVNVPETSSSYYAYPCLWYMSVMNYVTYVLIRIDSPVTSIESFTVL